LYRGMWIVTKCVSLYLITFHRFLFYVSNIPTRIHHLMTTVLMTDYICSTFLHDIFFSSSYNICLPFMYL